MIEVQGRAEDILQGGFILKKSIVCINRPNMFYETICHRNRRLTVRGWFEQ